MLYFFIIRSKVESSGSPSVIAIKGIDKGNNLTLTRETCWNMTNKFHLFDSHPSFFFNNLQVIWMRWRPSSSPAPSVPFITRMKTALLTSTCRLFPLRHTGLPLLLRLLPAQMKFSHPLNFTPKETQTSAVQNSPTVSTSLCLKANTKPSLVKHAARRSPGHQMFGDTSSLTLERDHFTAPSVTELSSTHGIWPNIRVNIMAWPFLSPVSYVGALSLTCVLWLSTTRPCTHRRTSFLRSVPSAARGSPLLLT